MSSEAEEPPRKVQKCCGNGGGSQCGCLDKVPVNVCRELQSKLKQEILKSINESYSFLRKYMSGREIPANCNRRRRHAVWIYYAPSSDATELGDRVEICQRAFREIFGVSERFMRNAIRARDDEDESVASPAASLRILPGNNAVRLPTDIDGQQVKEWRLVKEYKGGHKARFKFARGIAVCSNGDIVVADYGKGLVYLFSAKCVYKQTLTSRSSNTEVKLLAPIDVTVTSRGCIVVVDTSKYVKVFDENGAYSRSFCTLTEDEDPDTRDRTVSVVASSQGNILVGDYVRHLVTIHSETDGNIIGKVNVNGEHLAVTSNQTILASGYWMDAKVVAYDLSGNTVFSIDTWMLDGKPGAHPSGLTCDSEDNLYIAVRRLMSYNSGHIHKYNYKGEYMRCIAKGLYDPSGMTWSNGSLYVANYKSILIYSTV